MDNLHSEIFLFGNNYVLICSVPTFSSLTAKIVRTNYILTFLS